MDYTIYSQAPGRNVSDVSESKVSSVNVDFEVQCLYGAGHHNITVQPNIIPVYINQVEYDALVNMPLGGTAITIEQADILDMDFYLSRGLIEKIQVLDGVNGLYRLTDHGYNSMMDFRDRFRAA